MTSSAMMEFFFGIAVITVITVAFVADSAVFFAAVNCAFAAAFATCGFTVVAIRILSILLSQRYGKGSDCCKA